MDDICRLCCSSSFVTNNIFDEENALYLKMSLYLPIKVFKNDRLPQKVCDKCSCKVNDFYQFCNETIEVQERLRAVLIPSGVVSEDIVDLTRVKENLSPVPSNYKVAQSTQTEWSEQHLPIFNNEHPQLPVINNIFSQFKVKEEPEEPSSLSPLKEESGDTADVDGDLSDNSDDLSLITLKERKRSKKELNGVKKKTQKTKKYIYIDSKNLSIVNDVPRPDVKEELDQKPEMDLTANMKELKTELGDVEVFNCCICFLQCYRKAEILQHYRQHAGLSDEAPPAPPPPEPEPLRCTRCRKSLCPGEWAAHWARHAARDRRPYRCALCEKSFRDPHQILKHGLTHKYGSGEEVPLKKRFVCDLCPEGFVYMRYLLAHRSASHPDASARALVLRCAVCARQFAHLNSLRRHLRAHTGERNYLCNVCGKALSSREHLKFHIRIHTGYKPNVCKTCGKGFVKKCNLTLHERVHSGEKPHVCAHCGKAFSQRSTLVIHERYHSGARPYSCALCHRGFVAKGLLSMHLKSTCI